MAIKVLLLPWPWPMAVGIPPIPCILRDSTFSHSAYPGQTQVLWLRGGIAVVARYLSTFQYLEHDECFRGVKPYNWSLAWFTIFGGCAENCLAPGLSPSPYGNFFGFPLQPSLRLLLASPPSSLIHGLKGLGSGLVNPNFLFPSSLVSGLEYLK